MQGKFAHFRGKDRFVTDKNAEASTRRIPHAKRTSRREISDIRRELSGKREPAAVRHELAEGNQMNFVIGKNSLARGGEKHGGVRSQPLSRRVPLPIDDAQEKITGRFTRNPLGKLHE